MASKEIMAINKVTGRERIKTKKFAIKQPRIIAPKTRKFVLNETDDDLKKL